MKRKDYLYEEQGLRISKRAESKEVKPELLAYSIQSLINLIDKTLALPITVSNIQQPEETGLKDISSFLKELKKTAQVFGTSFGSKMFNETIATLPSINLQDYRPHGLIKTLLGYLGYAGKSISYQPAVTKLQEDLGLLKASLNRLLLLVKNPSFEEAMQD